MDGWHIRLCESPISTDAVHRPMDFRCNARYPFLRESSQFAKENNASLDELLTSMTFSAARSRGRRRVDEALKDREVSAPPIMNEYDALIEILSYPYARMVVSQINDRMLTKRYALGEAVRMNKLLANEYEDTVAAVSEQLGVGTSVDADGLMRIGFPDYLRLAGRLKGSEWKLINSDIDHGIVTLQKEKFNRLLQNALQDKIESELPLLTPDEYRRYLQKDVDEVKAALAEIKSQSRLRKEDLRTDCLPPCINHILDMSRKGLNLSHAARFSLVTFLNALGFTYQDIVKVFSESPDFDESKSEYQVKHILGEINGNDGYSVPDCKTMRSNSICTDMDELCDMDTMTNPLKYYRKKIERAIPMTRDNFKRNCLPPCIASIMDKCDNGTEIASYQVTTMVAFLTLTGFGPEEISGILGKSIGPEKAKERVADLLLALQPITWSSCPGCDNLKSGRHCVDPDKLCGQGWVKSPLSYYRSKFLQNLTEQERAAAGLPKRRMQDGDGKQE